MAAGFTQPRDDQDRSDRRPDDRRDSRDREQRSNSYKKQEWRKPRSDAQNERSFDDKMDDYCRFHLFKGDDGRLISNHTMRNCREFDQMAMDYMMKVRRVAPSTVQPVLAAAPPAQPVPALPALTQHSAGS